PAWSRPLTENVWLVSARAENVTVVSDANALHAPVSSRYEKTRFPTAVRLSEPEKVKVPLATEISPLGPSTICVSGGVLSTRTTSGALAGLPAASAALATKVWAPSATVAVFQFVVVAVTLGAGGGSAGESVVV